MLFSLLPALIVHVKSLKPFSIPVLIPKALNSIILQLWALDKRTSPSIWKHVLWLREHDTMSHSLTLFTPLPPVPYLWTTLSWTFSVFLFSLSYWERKGLFFLLFPEWNTRENKTIIFKLICQDPRKCFVGAN